jgi:hypothetical protein
MKRGNMSIIKDKVIQFMQEREQWIRAGRPMRSRPKIRQLYDEVCKSCEHFGNDECDVCGCRIKRNTRFMNKLAWATTECPLNPPKWEAEVSPPPPPPGQKVDIPIEEAKKTKKPPRKCCGG